MLCSTEALIGITNKHIEKLEQVDRIFFRRLFQVPRSTAIESFYLETATLPVRFVLIGRRLMFFWNILQKSKDELVRKVYDCQKMFPTKNDFVEQVHSDLALCDIKFNEKEIGNMKKVHFKNIVNEKLKVVSSQYLIKLKNLHSKSSNLKYSNEMQPYLRNEQLSIQDKRLMFKIKNRILDVKTNYKSKFKNNLQCRLCSAPEESQPHLMECSEILSEEKIKTALNTYKYSDIFSENLETQAHLINTWRIILNTRKVKMAKLGLS